MKIQRAFLPVCVSIFVNACAARPNSDDITMLGEQASHCIRREAQRAAIMPVDLDTAAFAAMANCNFQIREHERAFVARHPGYRDYILPISRELNEARLNQAREIIAIARTR